MSKESKWLQAKEMTQELAIYIIRKASAECFQIGLLYGLNTPDYLVARMEANQKIFDSLDEGGYLSCIPIEGFDKYAVTFKFGKRPDDFYEVMPELEGESDDQN